MAYHSSTKIRSKKDIREYWLNVIKRKGLASNKDFASVAKVVSGLVSGKEEDFDSSDKAKNYLYKQYLLKKNGKSDAGHFVYFIGNKNHKWVKIGHTGTLKERLSTIQTSCPFEVEILGTLRVTNETATSSEKAIHERFSTLRLSGEWFKLTDEIEKFIEFQCPDAPKPTKVAQSVVRELPPVDFLTERKLADAQKPRSRRRGR